MTHWQALKAVAPLYKPYWGVLALGLFLAVLSSLAQTSLLAVSGWFLANMAIAGVTATSANYFTPSAMIRGLAVVRIAAKYIERLVAHNGTFKVISRSRQWFFNAIEPNAPANLSQHHSGEVLQHIKHDLEQLQNLYIQMLVPLIAAKLSAFASVLLFSWQSMPSAWLFLGVFLFTAVLMPRLLYTPQAQLQKRQNQLNTDMSEQVIETMQSLTDIKVYAAIRHYKQRFLTAHQQLQQAQNRSKAWSSALSALQLLLIQIMAFMLLYMFVSGAWRLDDPRYLPALFIVALSSLDWAIIFSASMVQWPRSMDAIKRLLQLLEASDEASLKPNASASLLPLDAPIQRIEWQNVDFAYVTAQPVLTGFNLKINANEKVLIAGSSGRGKSSLVNMLLGFWPIQAGQLLINERVIEDYDIDSLRQHIAVSEQHASLFTSTIRKNMLLGHPQASDDDIWQALKEARIDQTVAALPDGLDSWIGEAGENLSGGQRKRLDIARALIRPCDVLILDEPSEGLDSATADAILATIAQRTQTVLIISHRAKDAQWVDTVVKM